MHLRRAFSLRCFERDNRRRVRAQAAFIGVLYLFLSTFGTLTHTHPLLDQDPNAAAAAHAMAVRSASTAETTLAKRTATSGSHCVFCEWQATSLTAPTPPPQMTAPLLVALTAARRPAILFSAFPVRSTSRAPPAV
jgi:hypothetical protein